MSTRVALELRQSNDEVIDIVIVPGTSTDDLSLVTELVFYLKPDACTTDASATVTVLSSSDPTQIAITAQSATEIDATVYVPAASLAEPYPRVWRVDALFGTTVRTALYGPVVVIDL